MDMGDILNQWDNMKAAQVRKQKESGKNQISHKKANAPTKEEKELARARAAEKDFEAQMQADNEREINPMEMWLRRYGTIDKDKLAAENEERTKMQDRSYLVNMKPEAILDLHGLHQDEAEQRLNSFVGDCLRRREREARLLAEQQAARERALWEAKDEGMEVTMSVEETRRMELQENAISMAKEHPEDVAMLIRTWLMEE